MKLKFICLVKINNRKHLKILLTFVFGFKCYEGNNFCSLRYSDRKHLKFPLTFVIGIKCYEGNNFCSPRYSESLAYYIEHLGGACYMFLTHGDGAADHARWAKRVWCDRIMHIYEI